MKILLVEDDGATARLLSETLSADNYTVDVAADGETGREMIERWKYDLLALDIGVPGLDGLSLCRWAREKGYRMSSLMLTARDSNEAIITGLDAGADDYITQPSRERSRIWLKTYDNALKERESRRKSSKRFTVRAIG